MKQRIYCAFCQCQCQSHPKNKRGEDAVCQYPGLLVGALDSIPSISSISGVLSYICNTPPVHGSPVKARFCGSSQERMHVVLIMGGAGPTRVALWCACHLNTTTSRNGDGQPLNASSLEYRIVGMAGVYISTSTHISIVSNKKIR